MIISANFATHEARKDYIDEAVASIIDQVHEVRVYYNDYEPEPRPWTQVTGNDYTDRSKFYFLQENEIYFSCDDDLLYSPNYVENTLQALETHGGVVTYHGRKLTGTGKHYYNDHETFHFRFPVYEPRPIDVAGTGVSAFFTNEFMPDIFSYEQDKMVDLLFSLEAAKKGVPITVLPHKKDWIGMINTQSSIYSEERRDCEEQSRLANKIYRINY